MQSNLRGKHMVLAILLVVCLTACGGGGDGGIVSPVGLSYTGLTTQATIDGNNAKKLCTGAYQGGQTGTALGSVGAIQTLENGDTGHSRMLKVSQVLKNSVYRLDLLSRSDGVFVGAIYTDSGTIIGNCGGNATFTISVDDQTGDFYGSFNYNNYCEGGVTIFGAADWFGQVDLITKNLIKFSFSFGYLTVISGSDSFILDGDVSFDNSVPPATMTMTMLLQDNSTGKVYKVEAYTLTLTEDVNYIDVEVLSGRYFDPDYGYVSITTTTPLRIYVGDNYPSDGVIVATGNTGIAGSSTMAQLTALNSTTYQIEADTNGDGAYDWNSGVLNWSDL